MAATRNRNLTRKFILIRWVDPLRVPSTRLYETLNRSGRVQDVFSNNATNEQTREVILHAFRQHLDTGDINSLYFYKPMGSTSLLTEVCSGNMVWGTSLKESQDESRSLSHKRLLLLSLYWLYVLEVLESAAEKEAATGLTNEGDVLQENSNRQVLVDRFNREINVSHPICYDTYDLCEQNHSNMLQKFNVVMLSHFEIPGKSRNKKQILMDKLMDMISECECFSFVPGQGSEPELATHVLQFAFISDGDVRFPVAQWPSRNCTPSDLYNLFWKGVLRILEFGFTIYWCVLDGADCNRQFIQIHFKDKDPVESRFMTTNISTGEPMIFIMDPKKYQDHMHDDSLDVVIELLQHPCELVSLFNDKLYISSTDDCKLHKINQFYNCITCWGTKTEQKRNLFLSIKLHFDLQSMFLGFQ
ncbi:hypothetical protein ACROYT_G015517 [Oculina patagonica]